jgi:hypothetical protein
MKKMQVFDCQNMPEELCNKFIKFNDSPNDSYVSWYPNEVITEYENYKVHNLYQDERWRELNEIILEVNSWLKEQYEELDNKVLIKNWW